MSSVTFKFSFLWLNTPEILYIVKSQDSQPIKANLNPKLREGRNDFCSLHPWSKLTQALRVNAPLPSYPLLEMNLLKGPSFVCRYLSIISSCRALWSQMPGTVLLPGSPMVWITHLISSVWPLGITLVYLSSQLTFQRLCTTFHPASFMFS
jgi:hypothetical protein